nr:hypothetical protein [Oscillospiraceae bacterium]
MAMKKRWNRTRSEFKPDTQTATWIKTVRLTQLQRLRLLKWLLYVLVIVLALVVQDVIMSQFRILGATTDLAVCVILMITIIEGTEVGSVFVLVASTLYYFSGSAPGAYSIGLLSFLGIAAVMFRQLYLHRSRGSITLCTAIAVMGYELGLFVVGIFSELTLWTRLPQFTLTGIYSCLVLIPLYPLICKIGLIGGNTWKE